VELQFSGYFVNSSKLTRVRSELFGGILIAGKHFYNDVKDICLLLQ